MANVLKEKRQRGLFGKLVKWAFIGFNCFMIYWLLGYLYSISGMEVHSEAGKVGAVIGTTIGVSMIVGIWIAGDIILGIMVLLTRGDKIVISSDANHRTSGGDQESGQAYRSADQMIARYLENQARGGTTSIPIASRPSGFGRRSAG